MERQGREKRGKVDGRKEKGKEVERRIDGGKRRVEGRKKEV